MISKQKSCPKILDLQLLFKNNLKGDKVLRILEFKLVYFENVCTETEQAGSEQTKTPTFLLLFLQILQNHKMRSKNQNCTST
jgi:hypothetical protein